MVTALKDLDIDITKVKNLKQLINKHTELQSIASYSTWVRLMSKQKVTEFLFDYYTKYIYFFFCFCSE